MHPPHLRHCVTFNLLGGHILLVANRLCFIGTSRSNRIFPKCLALKSVLEGVSQKSSGTQYFIACMVCPGEHILTGCDIVIKAVIETLEDKSPPIFEITVVITLHGSLLVSNWKHTFSRIRLTYSDGSDPQNVWITLENT